VYIHIYFTHGIFATQVLHMECHGTGTPLGDPIEVGALQAGSLQEGSRQQPMATAAVKTSVGHLEASVMFLLQNRIVKNRIWTITSSFKKRYFPFTQKKGTTIKKQHISSIYHQQTVEKSTSLEHQGAAASPGLLKTVTLLSRRSAPW
jgi:hypothetical protein